METLVDKILKQFAYSGFKAGWRAAEDWHSVEKLDGDLEKMEELASKYMDKVINYTGT